MNKSKIAKFAKRQLLNENCPNVSCFYDVHDKKAFSENIFKKSNGNFVCQLLDENGKMFYCMEIDKGSDAYKGLIK